MMHDVLIVIGVFVGAAALSFGYAMWESRRYQRRAWWRDVENEYYSMCQQARRDGFIS